MVESDQAVPVWLNAVSYTHLLETREKAAGLLEVDAVPPVQDRKAFAEQIRRALYAAKIVAYAQGFSLLRDASERYHWSLDLGTIAAIFRAGCIIQMCIRDRIVTLTVSAS